ncbi:MAG: CDP-alcohol phosphatidyltransferase family protein [Candidatus Binatia bacterium]
MEEGKAGGEVLALIARALTLSRFVLLIPFLWLLKAVAAHPSTPGRLALAGTYAFIALSDTLDGRLARRANAASRLWGRIDVVADILFNFSALTAASLLGWMGPWVPAGVAILGGRFLWRIAPDSDDPAPRVREDRAGKLAGFLYYALVGWVVAESSTGGILGPSAVARGADAVFAYTLVAFWLGREPPGSSRRGRSTRSA